LETIKPDSRRVICPFTSVRPVVKQVLSSYGLHVEYVDLTGDDDAYRKLLQRLWNEARTVVIVEHDILPWPGAVEELYSCSCAWGAYTYKLHGGYGIFHGLGCAKLSTELMKATPGIWDEPIQWNLLDQILLFTAREQGLEPHHHRPAVIHLNYLHTHS
jgi:hypothetical protein